jgi:hypothetical protein
LISIPGARFGITTATRSVLVEDAAPALDRCLLLDVLIGDNADRDLLG